MRRCRVTIWCDVLRLSPCTEQPHPLVGHVTGDMKRRESNETLNIGPAAAGPAGPVLTALKYPI